MRQDCLVLQVNSVLLCKGKCSKIGIYFLKALAALPAASFSNSLISVLEIQIHYQQFFSAELIFVPSIKNSLGVWGTIMTTRTTGLITC